MAITSGPLQRAALNPAIGEQLAAWARTPIGLALVLTAGTLLGLVTMKLLVLFGWLIDWSWLRDNPMLRSGSDNCPNPGACVIAAAGAGGGSAGKGSPRGGKPPEKGPKDPVPPGRSGGDPSPGSYTPTKGSDPLHDPAFENAQKQFSSHNPQPTPSQPGPGGGVNINHLIQNHFWKKP